MSTIRWDDLHFRTGYDKWLAYGQAKTATVLFAVALDALGRDHGVRAFATHPGSILTPLQRHMSKEEMMAEGWIDAAGNQIDPKFKMPEQGAATQVWAATSPQLASRGGVYCEDCDIAAGCAALRRRGGRSATVRDRPGGRGPAVGGVGRDDRIRLFRSRRLRVRGMTYSPRSRRRPQVSPPGRCACAPHRRGWLACSND